MLGGMLKVSFFGESHGKLVGALLIGFPPGVRIEDDFIMRNLERRRGPEGLTTSRREPDRYEILSGVKDGTTTGAPILITIPNEDVDSSHYDEIRYVPRPSHADYPAFVRFSGFWDHRGGGIFSGRLTAAMVVAGSLASLYLSKLGIGIAAHVVRVGRIHVEEECSVEEIVRRTRGKEIECIDDKAAEEMILEILRAKEEGDSVGGVVEVVIEGVPPGIGEPPHDTLDGDLAKAMFVIPAVKGVEFGSGFKLAEMRGSEANDQYVVKGGRVVTSTNNMGGIAGGMSTGAPIRLRLVVKPTPSIAKPQKSVDLRTMEEREIRLKGRFDPCVAIRVPPVAESMAALVVADHALRWLGWERSTKLASSGEGLMK